MDWLSLAINPYSCLLVNTSISISCTNMATPTFTLGFSVATLQIANPQISSTKTVAIKLLNALPANTTYTL